MSNFGATSQFGIRPFFRYEVSLTVDRSAGILIPELQGKFCYIERADYPVLLNFVTGDNDSKQAIVAFPGKIFRIPAGFKGVVITHPPLAQVNISQEFILSLVCSEHACYEVDNSNFPASFASPYRTLSLTATIQDIAIAIPRGTRQIKELRVSYTFVAITPGTLVPVSQAKFFFDAAPVISPVNVPNTGYPTASPQFYFSTQQVVYSASTTQFNYVTQWNEINIPPNPTLLPTTGFGLEIDIRNQLFGATIGDTSAQINGVVCTFR